MIRFNDRELRAMEYLARSRSYKVWEEIFEKVIADLVDLRNIEGEDLNVELKARKKAAETLQEVFLDKLRRLSGNDVEAPDNEFE